MRQNATEKVYALILNQDLQKVYLGEFAAKNIPGGGVIPTGELVIDTQTILPKRITISSSAFSDPLFDFEITSTNIPVDIQAPTDFKSIDEINKENKQMETVSQLQRTMNFSYLGINPSSIFKLKKTFGIANLNGSCSNPVQGSLFSRPPKAGDDITPGSLEGQALEAHNFFVSYVIDPITQTKDMESYCYSTEKAYAVEIKIPGDTLYTCVDSSGFSKQISKKITGPKCQ